MRLTSQRVRVLEAVGRAGHGTAEQIAETVAADGGPALSASTIYRSLDALQELGLVAHTHVDHRAPDYHLASHAPHVHLLCRGCGRVDEVELDWAREFVDRVTQGTGFRADLTHAAIHGFCAGCGENEGEA